ncbi:MAG: hypothetical protein ABW110_02815 [Steroidobacteraceae bacterium]
MSKPLKVIVWGLGAIGGGAVSELLRRPEFEIVAVVGYNPAKNGVDVGVLLGRKPIGIKLTTDKEAVLAMQADVVLWCGVLPVDPAAAEAMNADVIRLLESGKNVVSPSAFHFPPAHGEAYLKRFEDACRKGKSSLHGTGENPGFWMERFALTLTGLCSEVESITLDEYADCGTSGTATEIYNAIGFGVSEQQALASSPLVEFWKTYYYIESMNIASLSLWGRRLDRFEHKPFYYLAEKEFVLDRKKGDRIDMHVPQGYVKAMTHHFHGYIDDTVRLTIRCNWFLTPSFTPFDKEDSTWDIEIEAKPISIKCTTHALASIKDNLEFRPGDKTSPTWWATIIPAIQAIPMVCAHEPGIVYPTVFANAVPDLRTLATRKSVVG